MSDPGERSVDQSTSSTRPSIESAVPTSSPAERRPGSPDAAPETAAAPPSGPARSTSARSAPAWLRAAVLGLVALLVAVSLVVVAGPDVSQPSATVMTYVPADGASRFSEQQTTADGRTTSVPIFTESARITGSALLSGLDWTLAGQVIGALDSDEQRISTSRYWRTISTEVTTGPQPPATTTRVYRLGDDVALLAESGPQGSFTYNPQLVELPADVRPGLSWRSSGNVGGPKITYAADFNATAGDPGCVQVKGTITYAFNDQTVPRLVERTWCTGGLVAESDDLSGNVVRQVQSEAPVLDAPATEDQPTRWQPDRWRPRTFSTFSTAPTFGEGQLSGAPAAMPPVQSRSGLIVQAVSGVQDLLALAPASAERWQSRWRAHPGGAVLTLSQFGDVTVATTSGRQMVGYDGQGVRRWSLSTAEVIKARPVRGTAADLIAVTLGGEVLRVDAVTGAVRWRTNPGSDVGLPPVVAAGMTVIADRAGSVLGLDLADGRVRWQQEVQEPGAIAAAGDRVGVASFGYLTTYDAATGDPDWRAAYAGTGNDLTLSDDQAVLAGSDGLRAYDLSGRQIYARERGVGVSTDGRHIVLWGPERAEVYAGTRPLTSFVTPPEGAGNPHRHLNTERGVYLFDSSWDFRGWTSD